MSVIAFVHRFLPSLGFTMLVETAGLFVFVRYVLKRKEPGTKDVLLTGALASFSTIPYVWFVFPYLLEWSPRNALYFSEPFAFGIEALIYRFTLKLEWKNALLASLACN